MTTRRRRAAVVLPGLILLVGATSALAQSRPDNDRSAAGPLQVGFLVLEGVYNSELMAPLDIFHHTVFHTKPAMRVFTVGRERATVKTFEGLSIEVEYDLESAPPIDVLVVPSAENNLGTDLDDERLIDWVRERGRAARFVLSLCVGALVLGEGGLLEGRFCTTFPGDVPELRRRYSGLQVVEGVTFVAHGNVITGVGGARSYEPALYLVEHLYGKKVAEGVGRGMVLSWDLDRERHLIMPDEGSAAAWPRSYLPGQRVDGEVVVEDADGTETSLGSLVERHGDVKAVVLCVIAGAEATDTARRGGVWCEDTFSELPNLRHLRMRYEPEGVLFVGVVCPPVHHEKTFGYDEGAFLHRGPGDPVYDANRERFVRATRALDERGVLPFDVIAYDPRFRLLRDPVGEGEPAWHGRFKWFGDSQTYGTPTIWVLTADLRVIGPPFFMNVYESAGRKLRYTTEDVARMIDACRRR